MKVRIFLIILFLCSVSISAFYFVRFLGHHPHIIEKVDAYFILLIIAAIILQIAAHVLRAHKSRLLLDKIRESDTATLFRGLSIGYLFNSLLPLRLGEIIRAFYVGDALAVSKTTVFMSIIIERLVDGVILGVSFIAAGLLIESASHGGFVVMTKLGASLLILSTLLVLLVNIVRSENKLLLRGIHGITSIFNSSISSRLRFIAWSAIYGTRLMLSDRASLRKYYGLSIIMWAGYFLSTAAVVLAFFHAVSFHKLWFITQSSYAGISTPVGPGYIGTFQLIVSRLLEKIDIVSSSGFSLLIWAVITLPISAIGLFVLIRQRVNQHRQIAHQDALINKLYREKDVSTEFSHFLDAYFNGEEINKVLTQAELDGKFKLVKSFKGGSNAHTMLVWQNEQLVVMKITLPQFTDKLQAQAQWLIDRENLPHLPKIVDEERSQNYYYFSLAYHENFFPFFDFIHSRSTKSSYEVLQKILTFMSKTIYKAEPTKNGEQNLADYIESKVLGKVNDTAAISNRISQLLVPAKLTINGMGYDNMLQVIEKIQANKQAMQDLASYQESPIHGDLTVDNLMASSAGEFLVIDPNNENQVSSPVVDYGKLYQSLHSGYEFLIQLESCQVDEDSVKFEDSKSQKYADLFRQLDGKLEASLDQKTYRSILFHEAVHYCRMLTYRANINPQTLPIFYATAVKLFNEFLEQYNHKR